MLVGTKPKRRNRLALPRPKVLIQTLNPDKSSQSSSEQKLVPTSLLTVTTVSSCPPTDDYCGTRSSPAQPGEHLRSMNIHPDLSSTSGSDAEVDAGRTTAASRAPLDSTTVDYSLSPFSYSEKKGKRSPLSGCSTAPGLADKDLGTGCSKEDKDCKNICRDSTKTDSKIRTPFQIIQHNARPSTTHAMSEGSRLQNNHDVLTWGEESSRSNSSSIREKEDIPRTDLQRHRRREDRSDTAAPELRKPGTKSRRLWPSGSISGCPSPVSPQPTTPRLTINSGADTGQDFIVVTTENDKRRRESTEPCGDDFFSDVNLFSTAARSVAVAVAGVAEETLPATEEIGSASSVSSGCKMDGSSGQRCPVCGSAVWGLSVRARQVHINSCLDGTSSCPVRAEDGDVGKSSARSVNATVDEAEGGLGTVLGRRSSTGVAKEPKTEFQADIQMAKALSKSLVVSARGVGNRTEEELQDEEELARDPAAFQAKEKRLVATLKDLDQKLERLQKDREMALKKLATHRALGARTSADSKHCSMAPKTATEVVDLLFAEEQDRRVCVPGKEPRRGEKRKTLSPIAVDSLEAMSAGRSIAPEQDGTDLSSVLLPQATKPMCGRNEDGSDGSSSVGGGDGDIDGHGDSAGVPKLTRRRSGSGRIRRDGQGHVSSSRDKTMWSIARDADWLSQSSFVTGAFADIRVEAAAKKEARARESQEARSAVGQGAQTSSVTASAYGDPSLYNRRPAGSDAGTAGAPRRSTPGSIDIGRRGPCSDSEDADSTRRQRPRLWRGNDDCGVELDSEFDERDAMADDAVLLLTQILSEGHAVPRRPNKGVTNVSLEKAAASLASNSTAEKIAERHIARAPVAVVSQLFHDWEENVRYVFRQGADELRGALESINAALSEEEMAVIAAVASRNSESLDGEIAEGKCPTLEAGPTHEGAGGEKAKALLFFKGVILDALEMKAALEVDLGSENDFSEVKDIRADVIERGTDVRDEGDLASVRGRRIAGRALGFADDKLPGEISGGDVSCRNGSNSQSSWSRNIPNVGMAKEDGDADKEGGDAGDILGQAKGEAQNVEDGSYALGKNNSTSLAAPSPTSSTKSITTIILSGDSSRDAIVTFDLTTSGEREATVATEAGSDALTPSSTVESQHCDGVKVEGGKMSAAADGGNISADAGDDGVAVRFDSFWDDPLAFPSPPYDDGGVADDWHAPLPSSSPATAENGPSILETARWRLIQSPIAEMNEPREQGACSFGLTGTLSDAPTRPPHATAPSEPPTKSLRPMRSCSQPVSPRPEPEPETGTLLSAGGSSRGPDEAVPLFNKMTQQELTGMMSVYGLKKKSKKEMVTRLEQIWSALHPVASSADVAAAGVKSGSITPTPVAPDSALTLAAGRCNDVISRGRTSGLVTTDTARAAVASGRPPLTRPHAARGGVAGVHDCGSDSVPSCSTSRQRPSSSARRGKDIEALGEQIRSVITGNAQLHEDILLFRTVELTATQLLLKDAGVKCSKRDLASFLDVKGVTFVDRGSGGKTCAGGKEKKRRATGRAKEDAASR